MINIFSGYRQDEKNCEEFALLELAKGGNPIASYKLGKKAYQEEQLKEAEAYLFLASYHIRGHKKSAFLLSKIYERQGNHLLCIKSILKCYACESNIQLFEQGEKIFNKKNLENEILQMIIINLPFIDDEFETFSLMNNEVILFFLQDYDKKENLSTVLLDNNYMIIKNLLSVISRFPTTFRIPVLVFNCIVKLCVSSAKLFNIVANLLPRDEFSFDASDILGNGGFSTVYKGIHNSNDIAIKKVDPLGHPNSSPFDMRCLRRECCILR